MNDPTIKTLLNQKDTNFEVYIIDDVSTDKTVETTKNLIKESSWFRPDIQQAANALAGVFMDYETFRKRSAKLGKENFKKFSYNAIQQRTWELLDKYVPEFPKQVPIKLPTLKKVDLPKLKIM